MDPFTSIARSRYFVIPENQRGFSWGERQVDDMIKDLLLAGKQSHYMGPVIVTRAKKDPIRADDLEETSEYALEDGQQRVTTLFLFANEIRKRLEDAAPELETNKELQQTATDAARDLKRLVFYQRGGEDVPRLLNANAELDQYFRWLIRGQPAPPAHRSPPMKALDEVHQYLEKLVGECSVEELIVWKNRITNLAKFILVDLRQESINRYLAFDAINSRGLPLSDFDKIKNFCILLATERKLPVKPDRQWYEALQKLEGFEVSSRADEAAFISDLYSTFHDERVSRIDVHEAFVRKYRSLFTTSDTILESEFQNFVATWPKYAQSFGFVSTSERQRHYGTLCTRGAGAWLDRLDNMDLPTIMRPVLTAVHMRRPKDEFERVARAAEIYTFRTHAVMGFRKDNYSTKIIQLASQVLRLGKDANYVVNQLCLWLKELAPLDQVIAELGNGKPKYYYDSNVRGWAHCYYFLYELEMECSPRGTAPLPWAKSAEDKVNTQEHILPQTHRDGKWWQENWPDEAEADRYVHRLGNLVLTPNNSALGRKPFPKKLKDLGAEHSFTHPKATNSEKLIEKFTDGATWRPENVLQREAYLLKTAAERWGIPCCSDNGVVGEPENWPTEWKDIDIQRIPCFGQFETGEEEEALGGDEVQEGD